MAGPFTRKQNGDTLQIADVNDLQAALEDLTLDDVAETAGEKKLTAAERTKLTNVEAAADVTDAANVAAAGAVMVGGTQLVSALANNLLTQNPEFWMGTQENFDSLTPPGHLISLVTE